MKEQIPDEAIVVRGGQNQPRDIARATATHPSGITGVSVQCAANISFHVLAKTLPHGQVGVTTVAKVRELGGDVIRTSGRSDYHATLTGISAQEISQLLTPTKANPAIIRK